MMPRRPDLLYFPDPFVIRALVDHPEMHTQVSEIERRAEDWAANAIEAREAPQSFQMLEAELVKRYGMPYPSDAFDRLRLFGLNGWAIGVLEIESGAAKRRKSDLRYAAALMGREGALLEQTPDDLQIFGDGFHMAERNAYFLCRAPEVSVADLGAWWDAYLRVPTHMVGDFEHMTW
jgi:hypothetical protein